METSSAQSSPRPSRQYPVAPPPAAGSRRVPACPWCGPGSELSIRGDGLGGVALGCTRCGACGPTIALGDDFSTSDEAAITMWSRRSSARPPADVFDRVRLAIGLHRLTGSLSPEDSVGIAFRDLDALVRAAAGA